MPKTLRTLRTKIAGRSSYQTLSNRGVHSTDQLLMMLKHTHHTHTHLIQVMTVSPEQ